MSNTQTKNVPELRFPGFEGEWEEKKLGNLTDRVIRKNKNLESKKPLTISGQLGLIDQTEYFSKSVSSKNLENYTLIKNGEFAYNKSYSNGYPLGAIKRLTRYDSGVLSSLYICFSIKSEMSKDFMEAYFDSTHWYREVSGIAVEGARNHGLLNVSVNDFFTILIKYPSLEEQQKIGKFFSKLDRQIELEEQKLELLQQQKKCYIQKIFSQELRFKDEEGNYYKGWNKKQLKDVLEFSNKRTINENEYPVLTSSRQGLILQSDYYKDRKTFAESNIGYFILPKNHITYRSRSDDGIFKFNLNLMIDVGIISKYYPVFKGIDANQYYLTLHLNYQLKKEYIKYATGTSQLVLSQKDLQNIKTKLPSYEEQQKIGDFFSEIDRLVEKQSSKVGRLKVRKKELLQKMFV
ncbi:restriction endonuclease subunit S [Staphylococcus aureus]|uniref:restriction endonuclease subunit S n=6 Tax=Staphylococcus aureus TaxID=1280 RepID=UPI000449384F|nr:restriction endonuclease subunit S [Staphylococcus aureus]EUQ95654.1 type I restriction-modification enzyme, S subunit [Staphylococcus aureus PLAC6019]EUR37658.1 type I restriction-modification enzyme, S subunit [Staphylococcus aureus AMMC6050]EVC97992.1 type I restriction-modification enzyme, S subunit [Staphylococcus aureus WMCS6016]EVD35931.1 type I restriction-modification enzyme, S subunit [Staphylococcus aureus SJUD6072]EVD91114.1 type I restriction-modification enzyme, S subunit [Sta